MEELDNPQPEPKEKKLTPKQEAFCQEYLVDLNLTQAAIRAGYSRDTAHTTGWETIRKPEVAARIKQLREEAANGLNLTRERILQELSRIAFFDIRKIVTADGAVVPVVHMGDDEAAVISSIEVEEADIRDDAGEVMATGRIKKIKLADKLNALNSLTRMMGYNAPDKVAMTDTEGKDVAPVRIEIVTNKGES